MGNYAKVEQFYQQALKISRTALGEEHPDTAIISNNLAGIYQLMGDYTAAEPFYQ